MKVDTLTTAWIIGVGLVIGTPTLIFCGWLSDIIGRKPVILGGFFLAAVTYYPLYAWLGSVSAPGTLTMGNVNFWIAVLIVAIMVNYVGMVYGPIGAFLAEFFPGRIRYTAVSMPYMIGNGWGGGLVPIITVGGLPGDRQRRLRADLSDRRACGVLSILSLFLMPETRQMSVWDRRSEPAWSKSLESKQSSESQSLCGARSAPHLFSAAADELQDDFAAVRPAPVLDQIDALPGAEREFAADDRHMQRHAVEHGLDMRRHVVRALDVVDPGRVFRRQTIERRHQVGSARRDRHFPGW